MQAHSTAAVLVIAAAAAAGVLIRPWRLPEATWAVLGAAALVGFGLLSWRDALAGIDQGRDVYLFLAGMMLLAELARNQGLFDWLAAVAVARAKGSAARLFALIYAVGILVTVLLSNDATAVVLTPAVSAAARAAGAKPLPYLLICAFIANAASFVLPISNPANLVVFGTGMPHLSAWLAQFLLPSLVSIAATYAALWLTQRRALKRQRIATTAARPVLGVPGRLAACGILATGVTLLACSALAVPLGLPTFIGGAITAVVVLGAARRQPWPVLGAIAWGVLPLVAGLFVLVQALDRAGLIADLTVWLQSISGDRRAAVLTVGIGVALASNAVNNLPVALIAGSVLTADRLPDAVAGAMLIGVDLGPNLSVAGSLATILWLIALRREGEEITARQFLKLGALIMTPALVLALAVAVMLG